MPPPNIFNLKQRHLLFGTREFTIREDAQLRVCEKSLLGSHETLIPLNMLQPNPTYTASFAIKWLLTGLFTALLTLFVFYWANSFALKILYGLGTVLAGTTAVIFYRFFLYTTRLTIFRHRISDEYYLFLWHNRPDKQQFNHFVSTLSQIIDTITGHSQQPLQSNEPLPGQPIYKLKYPSPDAPKSS